MELVQLVCNKCGATMDANMDLGEVQCLYCGSKIVMNDEAIKITRVERAKLEAQKKRHDQSMREMREKDDYKAKKEMKGALSAIGFLVLFWVCVFIFIKVLSITSYNHTPTLHKYNMLEMGMTYDECRVKLAADGQIVYEDDNQTVYVWYNVDKDKEDRSEDNMVIRLVFEGGKLVERNEYGLKY